MITSVQTTPSSVSSGIIDGIWAWLFYRHTNGIRFSVALTQQVLFELVAGSGAFNRGLNPDLWRELNLELVAILSVQRTLRSESISCHCLVDDAVRFDVDSTEWVWLCHRYMDIV